MRSAEFSGGNGHAFMLAEAGINEAMAVLAAPQNNALDEHLLGLQPDGTVVHTVHGYEGGQVEWWGTLDEATATWTLTSIGRVANTTGPNASPIERTITARSRVAATLTQPLNNPAWNYIFTTGTGTTCDVAFRNSIKVDAPLYVMGNLCLRNSAVVSGGPLVVHGRIEISHSSSSVGEPGKEVNEVHSAGGCVWGNSPLHIPCRYGQGSDGNDNVWAATITADPPQIEPPTVDWDGWYQSAVPGPFADCTTKSGPVPTFDTDTVRNASVFSVFNLTPSFSYTCRYGPEESPIGELSWDAPARRLKVAGTIFIDGSATVDNNTANSYDGTATLYLSGTLRIGNGSGLCAVSDCEFESWDPNGEMLLVVANGDGGQVTSGSSVELVNSSRFQGGLFATNAITLGNSADVQGPMVASTVFFTNSVDAHAWPLVTAAPSGTPGNPTVHAQPQPPELYSG